MQLLGGVGICMIGASYIPKPFDQLAVPHFIILYTNYTNILLFKLNNTRFVFNTINSLFYDKSYQLFLCSYSIIYKNTKNILNYTLKQ